MRSVLLVSAFLLLSLSVLSVTVSATPPTITRAPKPYQETNTYCDTFLDNFYQNNMTIEEINIISSEMTNEINRGNMTYCCKYSEQGPFYELYVARCKENLLRRQKTEAQAPYKYAYYSGIYYIDIIFTFITVAFSIPLTRKYIKKDKGIKNISNILFTSLVFLILFYISFFILGDMIFRVL